MIEIIKVELFRLKKSTLFWVMFALTLASPVLSILLWVTVSASITDSTGNLSEIIRSINGTITLLQEMPQVASDAALWALIATAVVLSKEFVDGTMRNVVLANKSRAELYFGYLLTSFAVAVMYLLSFFAVVLIIAAPIFGFGEISAAKATSACFCSLALGIFAVAFVESCVCMFMFGVRKQWAAILLPILVILFGPAIFTTIVGIVSAVLAVKGEALSPDAIRWVPFANMQNYNPANIDGVIVGMNILYLAVFITVFVVSGYYTFKKADLK